MIPEHMKGGNNVDYLMTSLAMYQSVIDRFIGEKDLNILDVGCNYGYGVHHLSRGLPNAHILGVDIDSRVIDETKKVSQNSNIRYSLVDFTDQKSSMGLIEDGGPFDVITCFEVLEHIENAKSNVFINNLKGVLKPGGKLLISTPNRCIYGIDANTRCHVNELQYDVFLDFIKNNGLEIDEVKGVSERPYISSKLLINFGLVKRDSNGSVYLSVPEDIFRKFIVSIFEPSTIFSLLYRKIGYQKYLYWKYKNAINNNPRRSRLILVVARQKLY